MFFVDLSLLKFLNQLYTILHTLSMVHNGSEIRRNLTKKKPRKKDLAEIFLEEVWKNLSELIQNLGHGDRAYDSCSML